MEAQKHQNPLVNKGLVVLNEGFHETTQIEQELTPELISQPTETERAESISVAVLADSTEADIDVILDAWQRIFAIRVDRNHVRDTLRIARAARSVSGPGEPVKL